MPQTTYLGRRAVSIENADLRLTVTVEGGHIAEVYSKAAGVNPLWVPNWATMEPSAFSAKDAALYGTDSEAKLLSGILGHNLCLDLFGGPSDAEHAAGMTPHGESSVLPYEITEAEGTLVCRARFPLAQLAFERTITLAGPNVLVEEKVTNLTSMERPLAWTQHVTLSPPFLDPATTEFRITADRGAVSENAIGEDDYMKPGAKFAWPHAPLADGTGTHNINGMKAEAPASSYVAARMIAAAAQASWTAWSPEWKLAISCVWKPADFPWLGLWEENRSRTRTPWNNAAVTRGMEFGTSPFPESRRAMVERGRLLDTPCYRWLPANGTLHAAYSIRTAVADRIPETPGAL